MWNEHQKSSVESFGRCGRFAWEAKGKKRWVDSFSFNKVVLLEDQIESFKNKWPWLRPAYLQLEKDDSSNSFIWSIEIYRKTCKTYDTSIEKEGGKVKRWWEPGEVWNEKNTFFCYLWVGVTPVDFGVWTFGHAQISGTGFPPDSEAAQTARSWSGNRKGGNLGCDAQLRWAKNWWEDLPGPSDLTASSPRKKWTGLEDDPASFWGSVYFQVLLLLVSGRN